MKTIISLKSGFDSSFEDGKNHREQLPQLGTFIREARLQKGLTQEQLAQKCGTDKAYISKVEKNQKDLRYSSLLKIVEMGLDGELNITITL